MSSDSGSHEDDATTLWRRGTETPGKPQAFSVGRADTCDFVIADDSVSRFHALLTPTPQGFAVQDNNSSNGTWVNGREVTQAVVAAVGSEIRFGHAVRYVTMTPDGRAVTMSQTPPPGRIPTPGVPPMGGGVDNGPAQVSGVPTAWWKTTAGIIGIVGAAVAVVVFGLVALVVLASLGQESEQQAQAELGYHNIPTLEASIATELDADLASRGWSVRVDDVTCIKSTTGEYTCLADFSDGDRQTLIVTVDEAGQSWISR